MGQPFLAFSSFFNTFLEEIKMGSLGRALVVGWTGETGSDLVKAMLKYRPFSSVSLLGRRTNDTLDKTLFEQKIIDFENLKQEDFDGHSHVFCLLGTTRGKAGADGFVKVDKDYVENVAKASKQAGVEHFHLMTAQGSNPDSPFLYPSTKGKVEQFVQGLDFEKLTIYQPGLLLCDRKERRIGEFIFQKVMTPVHWGLGGSSGCVKTSVVAEVMLKCAKDGLTGKIPNGKIHQEHKAMNLEG